VDRSKFFLARERLFITLGISPGLLEGKSILEFGPGTGHNSLHADSLRPRRFVLVDGDKAILEACQERLEVQGIRSVEKEFVQVLFEDYSTEEKFDLVIAEACIPNQPIPTETLRQMLSFLKPGGAIVFTTVSPASWLSEITRRIVKIKCTDPEGGVDVERLCRKLETHFVFLEGMARSPKEWILDNLIQPLSGGQMFSIPSALSSLTAEYQVSGLSPMFFQDWRWYKDPLRDTNRTHNEIVDQYHQHITNFLDRRTTSSRTAKAFGERLELLCSKIWADVISLESIQSKTPIALDDLLSSLNEVGILIEKESPITTKSIEEAIDWIKGGLKNDDLKYFPNWWGRAQQHVGVMKSIYGSL
jgi:SAM-dependent methyltransferase